MIRATTTTTIKTPTHTPALKISAIAWQLVKEVAAASKKASK